MLTTDSLEAPPGMPATALPPMRAADMQDHLKDACNDLTRLQRLLGAAGESLMVHHHGVDAAIRELPRYMAAVASGQAPPDGALEFVRVAQNHLRGAVTALQFQDMSTQLLDHTHRQLRACAHRLAHEALADEEDGAELLMPSTVRPNPVTQDQMNPGAVELF